MADGTSAVMNLLKPDVSARKTDVEERDYILGRALENSFEEIVFSHALICVRRG